MSYRPSSSHTSFQRSTPVSSYRAASTYGGAGGQGTRISSTAYGGLRSGAPAGSSSYSTSSFKVSGGGMGMGGGMGAAMGLGMGGLMKTAAAGGGGGGHVMGNEKGAMQNLNDRLANYLETVRNLEQANGQLEMKILEALEKGGPDVRDYSKYSPILDDLRKKVFDATVDNASLLLQIDNARLAADDFKSVEADIAGLKKVIDDTNMGRMNVESEIEAVREELIFLRKNHGNEVMEMRNQITQSGVQVDVDAPKGQDLSLVMEEMRAKYEKMALKNTEDLKVWHENQISDVQVQVSQNTEALQGAQVEMSDLHRQLQTLEIELASQQSLKSSLEDTLRNVEMRSNMEVEKYNAILIRLESELTNLRGNIQQQGQEYEALLNMKMKLEAEIATYRSLLDGGDFKLQDAMDELKP
ncbi:unnamed protein product [Coregonus sp. 'balchen']|nr:unnamed protein product [Coregonus sp. 'balchen']